MPRFSGYGYKVVGSANGVVTVAPNGFGQVYDNKTVGSSANTIDWSNVPGSSSSEGSFAPPLAYQIAPLIGTARAVAQRSGMLKPLPITGGLLPNVATGGSTTPGGAPPIIYECPDGMRVTDPSLCGGSGMKKYLLPAAIVVGAIVLFKLF